MKPMDQSALKELLKLSALQVELNTVLINKVDELSLKVATLETTISKAQQTFTHKDSVAYGLP